MFGSEIYFKYRVISFRERVLAYRSDLHTVSNKLLPLTPRETAMLLILTHATGPLTLEAIRNASGYRSIQPFRTSARFLEAEQEILSTRNDKDETVYAIHPKEQKA
jgi:hypothetical protein